jgi:hypothetical protein
MSRLNSSGSLVSSTYWKPCARTSGSAARGLSDGDRLLACSRIFFYLIHGIAATYNQSAESSGELMERLSSAFDAAVDAMLAGLLFPDAFVGRDSRF